MPRLPKGQVQWASSRRPCQTTRITGFRSAQSGAPALAPRRVQRTLAPKAAIKAPITRPIAISRHGGDWRGFGIV
jgi:hypothetical protein